MSENEYDVIMSSMQDVAKEAGVSPATVSRTFRTPEATAMQTRQRVLEVAERLNYRPRLCAEIPAAAWDRSSALGFLISVTNCNSGIDPYHAGVLTGAQEEAGRHGLHLIVRTVFRHQRSLKEPIEWRSVVAGALLVGDALPDVIAACAPDLPAVLIDDSDRSGPYDRVMTDSFYGALAATRHLISMGHRRIAFVLNASEARSFQERLRGYRHALWDAGIQCVPEWVLTVPGGECLTSHLEPLLKCGCRPTAIVAASDLNAFAIMAACHRLGLSIPGDISVIGFDDISLSAHSHPPLTTMRADKEQVGRLAVRRLLDRIEERKEQNTGSPAFRVVVPAYLIERDSCAPPRRDP